jgi:hypothetical protein
MGKQESLVLEEVDQHAKPLWDFLELGNPISKSDAIIVCGSQDLRIPKWGAGLVIDGWADLIVMSGGIGRLTPPEWTEGEAGAFAEVAFQEGVAKEKVIADNRSTNTRENLLYGWQRLQQQEVSPKRLIIINQPFMQRRTKGLLEKMIQEGLLDEVEAIFPPSPFSYENYPNEIISKEEMVSLLVGEVLRLKDYPSKGFITPQDVPDNIMNSAQKLLNLGYTQYSI